jgi:HSP20 family molecular chaperone IbpA
VELPGEEKDNIKADFKEDKVEVKAKNFYKLIDLPTKDIDKENISTKYTNGVLEISIPKKKTEFEPKHYRL